MRPALLACRRLVESGVDHEPGDCEADDAREPLAEELVPPVEPVDDLRDAATF